MEVFPVLELDPKDERLANLVARFETRFGSRPVFIARAPGRVNLIGEHVDYSCVVLEGGRVFLFLFAYVFAGPEATLLSPWPSSKTRVLRPDPRKELAMQQSLFQT